MKNQEKYLQYAAMLTGKVSELFDEDVESDYHIDQNEFKDDSNLTDFIHALANVMPTHLFNKVTGGDKNQLEFNHIANQLCFQYGAITDSK